MVYQPVLLLHVKTRFHISVTAAGELSSVTESHTANMYVIVISPVHFLHIVGLVLNAHCRLSDPRPLPVLVSELCAPGFLQTSVQLTAIFIFRADLMLHRALTASCGSWRRRFQILTLL